MKTLILIISFSTICFSSFSQIKSLSTDFEKMNLLFEKWKTDQVKLGNLKNNCSEFNLEKWTEETRFGLIQNQFDVSFADINGDGKIDGLFKISYSDCAQGNGDVGTPKFTEVLIVSNPKGYQIDEYIINHLKVTFKKFKLKHTKNPSERIYDLKITKNNILGNFILWREDDCYACSSLKGWINIDLITNLITFTLVDSNTNSIIETADYKFK